MIENSDVVGTCKTVVISIGSSLTLLLYNNVSGPELFFCRAFKDIPREPEVDFLPRIRVIAGSSLFLTTAAKSSCLPSPSEQGALFSTTQLSPVSEGQPGYNNKKEKSGQRANNDEDQIGVVAQHLGKYKTSENIKMANIKHG